METWRPFHYSPGQETVETSGPFHYLPDERPWRPQGPFITHQDERPWRPQGPFITHSDQRPWIKDQRLSCFRYLQRKSRATEGTTFNGFCFDRLKDCFANSKAQYKCTLSFLSKDKFTKQFRTVPVNIFARVLNPSSQLANNHYSK